MTTGLDRLFNRTTGQRRGMFGAVIAGVIIVPLVIAGFFAGALGSADARLDTVPAVVVNNDTMVTTTNADGTKQPVLAGRQLVTELTGDASSGQSLSGLQWTISNSKDARAALASGAAYAVVTIPKDFSKSVLSVSTSHPTRAQLSIRTDDAHSYLAGSVAQSVGTAMTNSLGKQITTQYLSGLYGGLSGMGDSLSKAADGAGSLSHGVSGVADGLSALSDGAASAATGAASVSDGIDSYTRGVDTLSTGLAQFAGRTTSLEQLGSSTAAYANGTAQLAAALAAANTQLQSDDPVVSATGKATVAALTAKLTGATSGAPALAAGATQLGSVHSGIVQLADGASQLAAGSAALRSGAGSMSEGVSQLATGASASAAGAAQLQTGAQSLADGLKTGASQASALTDSDPAATAQVVADPVGVTVSRANPIQSVGSVIGMIFVPVALWIGALAIFLLLKPMTITGLASTASTARIVTHGFARAGGLALAQAIALTALLHIALGVSWTMVPATLAFSLLLALVFTAIHYLLTIAFGRVGIVVSIVLLALQLTAVTGLVPLQVVAAPFQALSPLLPMTYAIQGMQGIVSGVGGGAVAGPAIALLLMAALSMAVAWVIVVRKRGVRSFGFAASRGTV
jgi:YhgE/Pip-like protein